jgi:hypothetical protein
MRACRNWNGLKRSLKIPSDSFIADSIRPTLYSCAGW